MSMTRQIRRAAERRAAKVARKQERQAAWLAPTTPEITATAPLPESNCDDSNGQDLDEPGLDQAFLDLVAQVQQKPAPTPLATGPTGPRTPEGKAISSLNNLKHGLTGAFRVLEFESQSDFAAAHDALIEEHQPATPTESQIIRRMAEHAWLSRRAQLLQDQALTEGDDKRFSLYMRYQTTNDRGFRASMNDLFRLRREQRAAAREFESQNRERELHDTRVRLANARAAHLELDTEIRGVVDAPIPGYSSIPVEQVKELFKAAMLQLLPAPTAKATA